MPQLKGTYIGQDKLLHGKTALLLPESEHIYRAQFDDVSLQRNGVHYGYGWHPFPKEDWKDVSNLGEAFRESEK